MEKSSGRGSGPSDPFKLSNLLRSRSIQRVGIVKIEHSEGDRENRFYRRKPCGRWEGLEGGREKETK